MMKLTATAFDSQYYEEHKSEGLDYLNHGGWQVNYGKWLIGSLNLENHRVLDVGCACGSIAAGLAKAGALVSGIDVNEHMVRLGRETFKDVPNLDLKICDGSNLHYWPAETFSAVHSAQVFEHFNPVAVPSILTEIHRVLKPGGLLVVFLDTVELFERQGRKMENEDPTHICVKTMEWWQLNLMQYGFEICADIERLIKIHPESYFQNYDWDYFVVRKQ